MRYSAMTRNLLPSHLNQMLRVASGDTIFFHYESVLRTHEALTGIDVHHGKEILFLDALVYYVHKLSPLVARLDTAPHYAQASGLHQKWERMAVAILKEKFMPRNFTVNLDIGSRDTPLNLEMLLFAIMLWSIGTALTCMLFVIEFKL